MATFQPFSFLTDLASKAVDVGKKVVSEVKEGTQASPFSQSLVGKGLSFVGRQAQNLGATIQQALPQPTIGSSQVVLPPSVGSGDVVPEKRIITPTNFSALPLQSPLFSPSGGFGSTYTDPSGNTYYFGKNGWEQITGFGPSIQPAPFTPLPPSTPTPPPTPISTYIPNRSGPLYNPETTRFGGYTPYGEPIFLTGIGGFGGIAAGQFGGGTGISGIAGGAQLLPGGLASPSRFTGGLPYIEDTEEKKRKTQTLSAYTVQPGDTINKIANRLGIDPSQISGFASGNPNLIRPGETLNIQGGQTGGFTPLPPNFQPISGPPVYVPPPITTPTGINLEAIQGATGFKQPEVLGGTVPGPLLNQGVVRTFNRVGSDVYETTGGQVNFVPPQQWTQVGLNGTTLGQLRELQSGDLNEAQKQMANRIAEQQGKSKPFPSPTKEPVSPVTEPEFTEQKVTDQSKITQREYDNYSDTQLNYYRNTGQVNPNALTPDTPGNGNNQYYKNYNEQTGEWEVIDSQTGNKLGPGIQANLGLKLSELNTLEGIQSLGKGQDINLEAILGFDPNKQIVSKNSELQKQAEDLAKLMKEVVTRDPFSGQTITQVRDTLTRESGLNDLYDERLKNIKEINEVKNSFDVLRADIEDDPDFSKRSKILRVDFINTKTQRLLDSLIRERELVDARITNAEKNITTRMSDMVTQYNIYRNQVNDIEQAYNQMSTRIDRLAENAQQTFQTLALNPELLKGITQSEISFITNNGYLPDSLLRRVSSTANFSVQGVIRDDVSGTIYAYNKQGDFKQIGQTTPQPKGVSPDVQIQLTADIVRYQNAIAAISNDSNKDYATKSAQINSLVGEIQSKYSSNTAALGIIKDTFVSASALTTQLGGTVTETRKVKFDRDLESELGTVKGFGKKGDAQRAQNRLLGEYPEYTATIKAAFSKWLK